MQTATGDEKVVKLTASGFSPADLLLEPGDSLLFKSETSGTHQIECLPNDDTPFCWNGNVGQLNSVGANFRLSAAAFGVVGKFNLIDIIYFFCKFYSGF